MPLYNISENKKLISIKEQEFKFEKELQELTDKSLNTILGFDYVCSEFSIGGFRIDTLAFDKEANSFVIIEYKRDKNFSVIDQGYAYLSLMLNNKADFILEYNEKRSDNLKRENVDWSQSRVIFISPSFTPYQREAINFKDLPIELWEVKRYANNTVSYSKIVKLSAKESIKTITRQDETIKKISKEIKVYTEQGHLENASEEIKELYENFKKAVLELGDLELKPKKMYLAFMGATNVTDIVVQKNALNVYINLRKGELDDPKRLTEDISSKGHWGNGNYRIKLHSDDELDYVLSLVKQSLEKNKK